VRAALSARTTRFPFFFVCPLALHRIDPDAEGEERYAAVGEGSAGQLLLVVVYPFHGDAIRLIAARPFRRKARRVSPSLLTIRLSMNFDLAPKWQVPGIKR